MSLNNRIKDQRTALPACFFAGVVDLDMGLMIGFNPTGPFTQDDIDRLAAAAVVYFESKPATQVAKTLSKAFDSGGDGPINEVVLVNNGKIYAYFRLDQPPGRVACFVADLTEDPAPAIDLMRASAAQLETEEVWA
jgi:hypothetical protein